MRFYKLTYRTVESERIQKRINDEGDSFDSLFENLADETENITKGDAIAVFSGYSPTKMYVAFAVRKGDIEEHTDIINAYLPPYISVDYSIEEITADRFNDYLCTASRISNFDANDIREKLGMEKVFGRRSHRELEFTESFIEKNALVHYSADLDAELCRIKKCGKPEYKFNPVHYIIGGNSHESRECLLARLLNELMENGRLSIPRYTKILIDNSRRFRDDFKSMAEECDALFRISEGGAVVFEIEGKIGTDKDRSSFIQEAIKAVCKGAKNNLKNTLCIFLLPDNNHASAAQICGYMPEATFVEIRENTMGAEKAIDYLKSLAKNDKIRANKSLYNDIAEDGSYYIDELNVVYNGWFKKTVIGKNFPEYAECFEKQAVRQVKENEKAVGDAYEELMSMIGLTEAKKVINEAIDYFKAQKLFADCGFTGDSPSMHMVFTGSPGTAKTTVARLFARIMRDNGILSKGSFVEVGRADLVGMFVGWTANIVKEKFKQAEGGVLFIDEAYSLVDDRSGSFGDEAINTIVQEMENNRDDTIVIFAGYSDKMQEFLNKNPGLRSRIAFHIQFEDYSTDELFEIAKLMSEKKRTILAEGVKENMISIFEAARAKEDFGNGRFVRNLMEKARMKQASRLIHNGGKLITREEAATLIPEDFEMPVLYEKKENVRKTIGF